MAPIDLPERKPDFVRPQFQDGLPKPIESNSKVKRGMGGGDPLLEALYTMTSNVAVDIIKEFLDNTGGRGLSQDRIGQDIQDKRKRADGIVDPTLPDVADAFDEHAADDWGKLPAAVIIPIPVPFNFSLPSNNTLIDIGLGAHVELPKLDKRDGEIVDPTLPDVADVFDEYAVDLKPEMQAKKTEGDRITRECSHGGAHCKPRMRGHGGRKHQPNEAIKAIDGALERRDQSESVLSQGSWEAACQNPTFENAKFCQGMVVQPRAGGASVAGIAAAAAIGAATAGHSAQGSLDILRDESSAYHWLLIALVVLVSLLLVVAVYYSAKKIRRQRAERAQAARAAAGGDADAVAIELQPMGKNGRGDGDSKC